MPEYSYSQAKLQLNRSKIWHKKIWKICCNLVATSVILLKFCSNHLTKQINSPVAYQSQRNGGHPPSDECSLSTISCRERERERKGECGRLNDHLVALPPSPFKRQTKGQKYFLICESIAHISLLRKEGFCRQEQTCAATSLPNNRTCPT